MVCPANDAIEASRGSPLSTTLKIETALDGRCGSGITGGSYGASALRRTWSTE